MAGDYSALLGDVLAAAHAAGEIIAAHDKKPRRVKHKGRIDLVTETDLAVEDFLKTRLAPLLPGASFMAEESYSGSPLSGLGDEAVWVIDPLDGTTNFAHQIPFVATSIGLWSRGRVELGVINAPLLGECFWAVRGGGAFCNGAAIRVSGQARLEDALVATGFPYTIAEDAAKITAMLRRVLVAAQGVRRCGAAAVDMAFLAAGRYDAFYENGLKAWDTAAGMLLVEEAGGTVSRYDGSTYTPGDDGIVASAGPALHRAMLGLLAQPGDKF